MCIVQPRKADHPADFGCAQAGCSACLESLLHRHEALIHFIARRQWPGQADYADLIQEGWIGLWLAILHFEPERGYTFSTYAGRAIRNRVWQAGRAEGWLEPQRAGDSLTAILVRWQQEQLHHALQDELSCLPESLRQVLALAFGLDGQPVLSLAAIATFANTAYLFERQGRDWIYRFRIIPVADDGDCDDFQRRTIAMSGNSLLMGSPGELGGGEVYLFNLAP